VLDNFDNEYPLFKRAAELQRAGLARRVLVPVPFSNEGDEAVAEQEVANTFARVAGLKEWDVIPIKTEEPVSLNAAYRVRDYIVTQQIASVTLVVPTFRSRRSELIYESVLGHSGITFRCVPVQTRATRDTWTYTWHGIQNVAEQFVKLQYYRFWVVPRMRSIAAKPSSASVHAIDDP